MPCPQQLPCSDGIGTPVKGNFIMFLKAAINARKSNSTTLPLAMLGCLTITLKWHSQVVAVPPLASDRRDFNKIKVNNQPAARATLPASQPTEVRGDKQHHRMLAVALQQLLATQ